MIIVKESCKCGDADAHKFACYYGCMEKVDQGKQYLRIRDMEKYLSDPDFAKIYVGVTDEEAVAESVREFMEWLNTRPLDPVKPDKLDHLNHFT